MIASRIRMLGLSLGLAHLLGVAGLAQQVEALEFQVVDLEANNWVGLIEGSNESFVFESKPASHRGSYTHSVDTADGFSHLAYTEGALDFDFDWQVGAYPTAPGQSVELRSSVGIFMYPDASPYFDLEATIYGDVSAASDLRILYQLQEWPLFSAGMTIDLGLVDLPADPTPAAPVGFWDYACQGIEWPGCSVSRSITDGQLYSDLDGQSLGAFEGVLLAVSVTATFENIEEAKTLGGRMNVNFSAVPEPSAALLILAGLSWLSATRSHSARS